MDHTKEMKHWNNPFQNCKPFRNRVNCYREIVTAAICSRPEVPGDVISDRNVKTIAGYKALNFKVTSSSIFPDFPKRSFCDGEIGNSNVQMDAICSHPEVAGDVVPGEETFREYMCVNLLVASFSSFRESLSQPFM